MLEAAVSTFFSSRSDLSQRAHRAGAIRSPPDATQRPGERASGVRRNAACARAPPRRGAPAERRYAMPNKQVSATRLRR
ncbi:hypothetical protein EYA88_05140 [Burkholderia pseudomallei]|uniref:hypothetical protein n=1 Tax=Burkholderia pseudomallei TaxID=28450 RepID=UPI00103735EB|nr:hypothetical protein EXY28_05125 [Burkholderia pseudomallei]QBL83957.1 hypothetical protein EYA88_05140 [Burkholderia pseudomallei]